MDNPTHILLVEDDDLHTELIRRAFDEVATREQFHLSTASSLAEARAYLAQAPAPDLIIADLVLPDGRGMALLPGPDERSPDGAAPSVPVILITSHGDEQVAVEAIKGGALDYVVKSAGALNEIPRVAERALRQWGHIAERRRAEEALRETQQRLQHLLSASPAIIYSARPESGYGTTFMSQNITAQLGYRPSECIKEPTWWRENIHPDDLAWVVDELDLLLEQGCHSYEYRFRHKDGSYRWMHDEMRLIRDAAGEPIEIVGTWMDITERVQAERALQKQNRALSLLNQASQALTAIVDSPQVIERMLRAALEITAAEGCSVWLWSDTRPGELVCRGIFQDGEFFSCPELRVPPGQGIVGWVVQTGQSAIVQDPQSDPRFFVGIDRQIGFHTASLLSVPLKTRHHIHGALQVVNKLHDSFDQEDLSVVETLAASAAIAFENARLIEGLEEQVEARTTEIEAERDRSEAILRSVGDAIMMADWERRIRYVNPAFTTLTGYAAREVLGRPARGIGAVAASAKVETEIEQALEQGRTWHGDMVGRRKDGRSYDAAVVITPLRDAEGASIGFVSTHRDISARKELERARTQFITNVSHQLRTPATNVKIYAGLLSRPNLTEKRDEYLEVMIQQSDQLSALVQDLLEITELDSGQAVRTWKPVALPELMQESMIRFQEQAATAGLVLAAHAVPPGFPTVQGDAIRLAQALAELIENGLRFTPAGGRVTLELVARQEDGREWATLAVHDTGPGLPPSEQAQVFERFFRGRLAESGHLSGTGLGLSIADEIVRAHGGRLTVDSPAQCAPNDAPGPGSTFTIWLPVDRPDRFQKTCQV